jgi:hypothetical protein
MLWWSRARPLVGTPMITPLAALMAAPMAEPMAVLLTFASNVGSGGKLDRETPSQNIVLLLLELDDILVSASAAESIDLYCVDWDGLTVRTCSKQKNKVTINCEATVLEYKSCFDLSSSFWQHFRNHLLMKLANVAKRSLRMLDK